MDSTAGVEVVVRILHGGVLLLLFQQKKTHQNLNNVVLSWFGRKRNGRRDKVEN